MIDELIMYSTFWEVKRKNNYDVDIIKSYRILRYLVAELKSSDPATLEALNDWVKTHEEAMKTPGQVNTDVLIT